MWGEGIPTQVLQDIKEQGYNVQLYCEWREEAKNSKVRHSYLDSYEDYKEHYIRKREIENIYLAMQRTDGKTISTVCDGIVDLASIGDCIPGYNFSYSLTHGILNIDDYDYIHNQWLGKHIGATTDTIFLFA